MPNAPLIAPELMSPAGDWDCAKAAVENGADAIYFGLQGGFNARARAANFTTAELPELMTFLRTRGVKGYLTLNTLVFRDELEEVERTVRQVVAAGVDAVLVQDIGLLRLIHRIYPDLPLHASTQMTLSSAECIREVESLCVRRVVLPRELSIGQIAAIRQQTNLELEAFVHGALCISYSGQCLASLSMGGRSANRGQCAQPCRLPYEVSCDGQPLGTPDIPYPLSPHDLAAYDRLPELIAAGVAALKIEGRLKPPEYVASVTRHYRTAIDAVCGSTCGPSDATTSSEPAQVGRPHHSLTPEDVAEMEIAFSRGFSHGWLDGNDPQTLVSGRSSAKRGALLGEVRGIRGERVSVELAGSIRRGDGVVFESDRQASEQGGRVYEIFEGRRPTDEGLAGRWVELAFRNGSLNFEQIHIGQKIWKTDDPQAARRLRQTYSGSHAQRRVSLDLAVAAAVGAPLRVVATTATGIVCRVESPETLPEAAKHPLTAETLTEQFGRLGKTSYALRRLDAKITGRPMVPLSVLGKLRHELVQELDAAAAQLPARTLAEGSALAALRRECSQFEVQESKNNDQISEISKPRTSDPNSPIPDPQSLGPRLHVLCRSFEQIEATLDCGVSNVIVDFHNLRRCAKAVQIIHAGGAKALLAVPRIHKPGESRIFELLAKHEPDGILVRNLAGLAFFRNTGMPTVADFSLNAVNELTIAWLRANGAERITASYDLGRQRLLSLAAAVPAEWLEVVVHRHLPMFHSEHCLFCRMLSSGKNSRDCGRPCERHRLRLRDRRGVEHLLLADSQCRNTLFHAEAENLAEWLPGLRQQGVRHFRIELLTENTAEDVRRVLEPFRSSWTQEDRPPSNLLPAT